jgi:hypothetical protein
MMSQNSSDPDGVSGSPRDKSVIRARSRKAAAALNLSLSGATWDEIAEVLGYPTARTARVAVERALERQLKNPDDRAQMRRKVDAQLNRLLRAAWSDAIDPKSPDQMVAIGKCRDILADHRKLWGLDAPAEVVVHNPTDHEIQAWVLQIVAGPPVPEYDIIDGEILGEETA